MYRVYLAARYSRHPEMQRVAEDLKAMGHEVTSRWISGVHHLELEGNYHSPAAEGFNEADTKKLTQFAIEDLEDLYDANMVICFTEEPKSVLTRGARHTEFGVGLEIADRMIVVGPRENIFHFLPDVEVYPTWEAAKAEI